MAHVTRTTVWSDNQVLTASALNSEFNNLLNALNLVNADVSASAAIVESKIAFNTSTGHSHNGSDSKLIQINRAFGFFVSGSPAVANDVSWNPTAPEALTAVKIWGYARTAPTGASLVVQVYDVTQSRVVASLTITAGNTSANSSTMTNAAIASGDILRLDVTAIGSSVPGANVSVVLECTQP